MTDVLSEMLTGQQGAVRVHGRIVITPTSKQLSESQKIASIVGTVVCPPNDILVHPDNAMYREMWECEILIIPIRKYSAHKKDGKKLSPLTCHTASQLLTGGFANPENWGDKYFDSTERNAADGHL